MIYAVPMKLITWDQFVVLGGPAPQPTPHCVGCLMVFDDEATAKEWADGVDIVHIREREYNDLAWKGKGHA